ncbi:MAG: DUF5711 family protein [Eubacteriales bacterium]|nr:DUF5711 family protein [Eubacteriales bacterium]
MAVINFRRPGTSAPRSDMSGDNQRQQEGQRPETSGERAQRANYVKQIRSHRLAVFLRAVLLLGSTAAIIALIVVQLNNRTFTEASFVRVSDITALESTSYLELNGRILAYSKDGASCIDTRGNVLWNITYEMQQPIVALCGGVAAIGDYGGSSVYVMDTAGQLGTIQTDLPVYSLAVAENGTVAAVLTDTDATWVNMFDVNGNLIEEAKMTMGQMGYPLSISVSPSGELLCVSHLQVDSASVKTSVAFYNFGAVGQNYSDNCVSGFDYANEVVPYVQFIDNETAFAVSDSRIAFFNGREIPQNGTNNMFADQLEGVYYDGSYVALVFPDTTGEYKYRLDLYNTAGSKASSFGFDLDYTNLQIEGDRILIYNAQECQIYSTSGTQKFAGEFGRTVSLLIPSARSNVLTVITDGNIETMTLQ